VANFRALSRIYIELLRIEPGTSGILSTKGDHLNATFGNVSWTSYCSMLQYKRTLLVPKDLLVVATALRMRGSMAEEWGLCEGK